MAANQRRRTREAGTPVEVLPDKWTVADAIAAAKAIEDGQKAAQADRRIEQIVRQAPRVGVIFPNRYRAVYCKN